MRFLLYGTLHGRHPCRRHRCGLSRRSSRRGRAHARPQFVQKSVPSGISEPHLVQNIFGHPLTTNGICRHHIEPSQPKCVAQHWPQPSDAGKTCRALPRHAYAGAKIRQRALVALGFAGVMQTARRPSAPGPLTQNAHARTPSAQNSLIGQHQLSASTCATLQLWQLLLYSCGSL